MQQALSLLGGDHSPQHLEAMRPQIVARVQTHGGIDLLCNELVQILEQALPCLFQHCDSRCSSAKKRVLHMPRALHKKVQLDIDTRCTLSLAKGYILRCLQDKSPMESIGRGLVNLLETHSVMSRIKPRYSLWSPLSVLPTLPDISSKELWGSWAADCFTALEVKRKAIRIGLRQAYIDHAKKESDKQETLLQHQPKLAHRAIFSDTANPEDTLAGVADPLDPLHLHTGTQAVQFTENFYGNDCREDPRDSRDIPLPWS